MENRVRNTYLAVLEWSCHVVAVCALLLGIKVVEIVMKSLLGEKILWDLLPLVYVFDTLDFVILALFLTYGVYSFLRTYIFGEAKQHE